MANYSWLVFALYTDMIESVELFTIAERFSGGQIAVYQRALTVQYSDLLITPIMTLTRLSCERNAREIDEQCREKLEVNRWHEI